MGISSRVSGSELVIKVEGKFDFSCHQEFRASYEQADEKPSRYVIDMSQATYLDSSALGMLLLLRDFAGGDMSKVAIKGANSEIMKILTISNFEKLFTME